MPYGSRTNKFRSLQLSNANSVRASKNNDATDGANELGILDSKSEEREEAGGGDINRPVATNEIGKLVYRSAKNANNPRANLFSNYLTKDYLEKRT